MDLGSVRLSPLAGASASSSSFRFYFHSRFIFSLAHYFDWLEMHVRRTCRRRRRGCKKEHRECASARELFHSFPFGFVRTDDPFGISVSLPNESFFINDIPDELSGSCDTFNAIGASRRKEGISPEHFGLRSPTSLWLVQYQTVKRNDE